MKLKYTLLSLCCLFPGKFIFADNTIQSINETPQSSSDANKPSSDANKPSSDANKPSSDVNKPSSDVNKPSSDVNKPSSDVNKPSSDVNKPSSDANKSLSDVNKTSSDANKSLSDVNKPSNNTEQLPKKTNPYSLHAIYSYSDFKYNSSTFNIINKFEGHSNLYLLGGNNLVLNKETTMGLFIYKLDSYVSFTQSTLAFTNTQNNNNTLFAHVSRQIKPSLYIDLAGGYGVNKLNVQTIPTDSITRIPIGYAHSRGNNWFATLKAIRDFSWKEFGLVASVAALHAEANQGAYRFYIVSNPSANNGVRALNSTSSFLLENVEITYKHSPKIQPFIDGGLIQVIQPANINPDLAAASVGSSPNPGVNLNKNGFSFGGGFSVQYKKIGLRIDQQYYQRGTVYHSNQSTFSLKLAMD
jgi:hypothetical protein